MFAVRRALACVTICAFLPGPGPILHASPPQEDVTVACKLLYEIADGIYVDSGVESGLVKGQQGWLEYQGKPLARVKVVSVTKSSTFLQVLSRPPEGFPRAGAQIFLLFDRVAARRGGRSGRASSPTLKDRTRADEPLRPPQGRPDIDAPPIEDSHPPPPGAEKDPESESGKDTTTDPGAESAPPEEAFVPLLAPDLGDLALTDAFNLFHGRLTVRELFQIASDDEYDFSITQIRSSGTLERIQATPWSLEWDGSLSYRLGEAMRDNHDFEEPRLEVFRFSVFRRFDDHSTLRIGRFVPLELPSVGFLDGAHGEKVIDENLRAGAMFGFKPRRDLDVSVEELTSVVYGTVDVETRDASAQYSGTAGLLASLYRGDPDRLAILVDQRARLGEFSLFASSELDFDIGGAEVRDGVRLTRLDLYGAYPVLDFLTLRGGLLKYERVDTQAENDALELLVLDEVEFLDRGFWRYWAGANLRLPWSFRLSGEVSVTDSERDDFELRGLVSLGHFGLPGLPSASATVSVYNLTGSGVDGYGARVSAYVPLQQHGFSLEPSVVFRYAESDLGSERFEFTDISLRAHWIISKSWVFSGAVSYSETDDVERALVDLGVTFKW